MPETESTLNTEQQAGSSPLATGQVEYDLSVDSLERAAYQAQAGGEDTSERTLNAEDAEKNPGEKADTEKTEAKGDEKKVGAGEDGDKKDVPFHEHPRFQELHSKAKKAEAENTDLRAEIENLKLQLTKVAKGETGTDAGESLPFKDPSKMTDDELLEWQSEDPKGWYRNILAQAKHEISQEWEQKSAQKTQQEQIADTYERFAKAHPDFDQLWDEGELQKVMKKNPGYDAIAAYWEMQGPKLEAERQKAVEEAVKEAEKKFVENQKAKRQSRVLSAGPAAVGDTPTDQELKNPDAFGGTTAVLARRLAERRRMRQANY